MQAAVDVVVDSAAVIVAVCSVADSAAAVDSVADMVVTTSMAVVVAAADADVAFFASAGTGFVSCFEVRGLRLTASHTLVTDRSKHSAEKLAV